MLRKRGSGAGAELPTTFNVPSKIPDGSVKSFKIEGQIAKAIRSADGFIKGSYAWLFISLFLVWGGWTWIRRNSASMVLDCNADGCTLTIETPYSFAPRNSKIGIPTRTKSKSKRSTKIEMKRDQLVRADNIKWDPQSQVIVKNYGMNSPTYASQQKKENEELGEGGSKQTDEGDKQSNKPWNQQKKKQKYEKYHKRDSTSYRSGAPDADGYFDSYVLILRDPLPPNLENEEEVDPNESPSMRMARRMAEQHHFMKNDPSSLASILSPYAVSHDDGSNSDKKLAFTDYLIHLRDFNIGQTRRLARSTVSKINAYTKGRRASCIVRESRPVAWQGLVMLILGIFSFVLCLLLGQFWEEYDPTKQGSYRKRMAEIRKREEARKLRYRKNSMRKPPLKRPKGTQTGLKGPGGARGTSGKLSASSKASLERNVGTSAVSTGGVRMRPNAAGAKKVNGGGGSAVCSAGGDALGHKQ